MDVLSEERGQSHVETGIWRRRMRPIFGGDEAASGNGTRKEGLHPGSHTLRADSYRRNFPSYIPYPFHE